MKPCGCIYCNDLRNIEPAKYIGVPYDEELSAPLKEARRNKQFIWHFYKDGEQYMAIVTKCPVCGYKFTEEDYDEY